MNKNYHLPFLSNFIFLLAIAVVLFSSCRSHKDLMYLRDVNGRETLSGLPRAQTMYRIKPKDNLYISIVTANPDLNKVYNPPQTGTNTSENNQFEGMAGQFINGNEVDAAGNVTLPIIGKVNLEGKTLPEAQQEIETKANTFVKQPTVKVRLLNFKVTVLGEVKNPGVYTNYNYDFTALEAIGMANGNTEFAALNNVLVLRPSPKGSQTYILNFNTKAVLGSEGYYLQPNDVIVIQPAKTKNSQFRISTASLVLGTISSILLLLNFLKD
ncbi:polysaccharide biosynthesis/export family protein [Mucilaginibacter lacusdianchii]|uniref:polysaccharide biosynthesis/export family protein n=1 Tax=Mucilaginibacter lacusdianchii TaxID=2684211 RepID=UPI00131E0862|nr:polysaccharide biosynthesis/export family protein [Mucilaginibacter sp. JXJ CY 39]